MSDDPNPSLRFLHPDFSFGFQIYLLAKNSKPLDLNSSYAYALISHHFGNTSLVATHQDKLVAFVTAYFPPDQPDTLFVWQVAVDSGYRGKNIAKKLLLELVTRTNPQKIQTTITEKNQASQALFASIAKELNASFSFGKTLFSSQVLGNSHDDELLFEINLHKEKR